MRELWFLSVPADYSAVAALCTGLPMLGWAPPAFGLLPRVRPPSDTFSSWKATAVARNEKLIGRARASGDGELDAKAFAKIMQEVEAGVLLGPFYSLNQIPSDCPGVAPRCGIREQHGEAVERDVRNIDDLLAGQQNTLAGSVFSHRPTDADALVAQCRAVAEKFPSSRLQGWSSDYSKAYKQVPADPKQCLELILVQYDPAEGKAAFVTLLVKCLVRRLLL